MATSDVENVLAVFQGIGSRNPEAAHQSAAKATSSEVTEVMMTNTFDPIRLAHPLIDRLSQALGAHWPLGHRIEAASQ
jgi:hypothetical protein